MNHELAAGFLAVLRGPIGRIHGPDGIFARIGGENVNSDFATFIRTVVILLVLTSTVVGTGQWQPLGPVAARTFLFLGLRVEV